MVMVRLGFGWRKGVMSLLLLRMMILLHGRRTVEKGAVFHFLGYDAVAVVVGVVFGGYLTTKVFCGVVTTTNGATCRRWRRQRLLRNYRLMIYWILVVVQRWINTARAKRNVHDEMTSFSLAGRVNLCIDFQNIVVSCVAHRINVLCMYHRGW